MNTKTKKDSAYFSLKTTGVTAVRVADSVIHLERGVDAKEFEKFAIENPQLFGRTGIRLVAKPIVVHVEDTDMDIKGYELIPYGKNKSDLIKKRRFKLAIKQALRNAREKRNITIAGTHSAGKSNVLQQIMPLEVRSKVSTFNIESKDVSLQIIEKNGGVVVWPIDKE